jgi:RNA-splicing ligase RtcB
MHERHGATKSGSRERLYIIWTGMRERCYRESHQSFKYYGGRGIQVCEEWKGCFSIFRRWALENGYRSDKSIERIDVDGNYEPANCKWATDKQQARNKGIAKNALLVVYDGKEMTLRDAAKLCRIGYTTLVKRYHAGERGNLLFRKPQMHTDHERRARAETRNGKARLTQEQVEEIRSSNASGASLARKMRVSESTISMIRSGQRRTE